MGDLGYQVGAWALRSLPAHPSRCFQLANGSGSFWHWHAGALTARVWHASRTGTAHGLTKPICMHMAPCSQLRILQDQHAELQAAVRAKDAELKELREVAAAATELQAQDVQAAKIIDLSKKVRHKSFQDDLLVTCMSTYAAKVYMRSTGGVCDGTWNHLKNHTHPRMLTSNIPASSESGTAAGS